MKLKHIITEFMGFLPPRPGQATPSSSSENDIMIAMDRVMRQMEAAKRALGLTNKLEPGPSRKEHRARIMSNMNKIRANLKRIEQMLETE